MKRQIALAYAIASLATAIAVVAVVGSAVGWSDPLEPALPLPAAEPVAALRPAASQVDPLLAAPPVREEVVYVDETGAPLLGPSATTRRHDDDDERHHDDDHEDDDHRDGGDRDHDDD